MDLHKLLSVNMATLVSLGTLLLAMGERYPWAALVVWGAAIVSVAVTDFTGRFALNRKYVALLGLVILCAFAPGCFHAHGHARLLALANMLVFVQILFLFQQKDERVCWWQMTMSLVQVLVAAFFAQGVWFGAVLLVYMLVGMSGMMLIFMQSQWQRYGKDHEPPREPAPAGRRWPLATSRPEFTSAPAGDRRAGLGGELTWRVSMLGMGTMVLALVFFLTVPRLTQSAYRGIGAELSPRTVVGFNPRITLGDMGQVLESREEVMRVELIDSKTKKNYPLTDQIYIRGSAVTSYHDNQWSPPPRVDGVNPEHDGLPLHSAGQPRLPETPSRPTVIAHFTVQPLQNTYCLFYVWPLVFRETEQWLFYDAPSEHLMQNTSFVADDGQGRLDYHVLTRALADGMQTALIPVERPPDKRPLLQMPALPQLTALAKKWIGEAGLKPAQQMEIARRLEWQLAQSGQFSYSLEGQERDTSIDLIEDFVTKHPKGHCEYFATALALMLRSQGIPSRVVIGYRSDEYHEAGKYFQVRQLHAHAWTEALLKLEFPSRPGDEPQYGWLRLDATPASDIGYVAIESTLWGRWEARFLRLQSMWDDYVVDMDRQRQRENVYEPMAHAIQALQKIRTLKWWRDLGAGILGRIGRLFTAPGESGPLAVIRWLLAIALCTAVLALLTLIAWIVGRGCHRRLDRWRARRAAGTAEHRVQIEFYRRLEHLLARHGLKRGHGQTPRELAQAAAVRLRAETGRDDLAGLPSELVEAFYQVRFGRQPLDNSRAETVEHALGELAAVWK